MCYIVNIKNLIVNFTTYTGSEPISSSDSSVYITSPCYESEKNSTILDSWIFWVKSSSIYPRYFWIDSFYLGG